LGGQASRHSTQAGLFIAQSGKLEVLLHNGICRSAEENRRRTPNQVEKNQGREEVDREVQLRILPPYLCLPANPTE
jgi:hypothetical protein